MTAGNFYKCIKAGETPKHIVNQFSDACNEAEKDGLKFARSIEALNSWAKKYEEHKGKGGADADSIADLRDGADKRQAVWSICEGAKKCVVFNDGTFKSDFSNEEINKFLNDTLIIKIRSMFAVPKPMTKMQKEVLNKVAKNKAIKLTRDMVFVTA